MILNFIRLQSVTVILCILSCFGGVESTWWFLSQLQLSAVGGSRIMCDNIPGLARRQRHLCQKNPDVMVSISRGASVGVKECQQQFQQQRWNCSTIDRDASVFGKVMLKIGSRETAFVYAISSAGVVHSITRSCSKGDLLNCACDPTKTGNHRDSKGEFAWGGCSDYVSYGNTFSRKFIDAREKRVRDARALMNLHNNRAGRKAVQKHVKLECKCHGVSGSCTVRTCWLAMMEFSRVGDYLKRKYDGATEVMMNQAGTGLIVAYKHHKKPTRTDQVYFEPSPDYCVSDDHTGSLGTSGRTCNKTSLGTDGCDIMCCGRGYDTTRVLRVTKCECKFQWCCYVRCKQCKDWSEEYTCKTPKNETPSVSTTMTGLRRSASGQRRPQALLQLHPAAGGYSHRSRWRPASSPTPSTNVTFSRPSLTTTNNATTTNGSTIATTAATYRQKRAT